MISAFDGTIHSVSSISTQSETIIVQRNHDLEDDKINSNGKSRKSTVEKNDQKITTSVNYHGTNIFQAAAQGNLPLCVLLWGIASAKKVKIMTCDVNGNNPMHFASLADSPEVGWFTIKHCCTYMYLLHRLLDSYCNRPKDTRILVFD